MEFLEELSDKEEDFIDRAVSPRIESRLGCQCIIQEGNGEIEVTLPDQTQFLGEQDRFKNYFKWDLNKFNRELILSPQLLYWRDLKV